jgi:hypothetical protein
VDDDMVVLSTLLGTSHVPGAQEGRPTAVEIQRQLAQIQGLEITSTLAPRGELLETSMRLPDGLSPDPVLASVLAAYEVEIGNLALTFPAEPLGEGAVWRTMVAEEVDGLTTVVVATSTLESFDGEHYRIVLDAITEQWTADGVRHGDVTLLRGSGRMHGEVEGVLTEALPTLLATTTTLTSDLEVIHDGGRRPVHEQVTTEARLERLVDP